VAKSNSLCQALATATGGKKVAINQLVQQKGKREQSTGSKK